jgi:hypothetical protein
MGFGERAVGGHDGTRIYTAWIPFAGWRIAVEGPCTYGFMIGVRHPDGRQLSGSMKAREHGGIATVCLHPITRLRRNHQRQRHHVAPIAEACEVPMNAIPASASEGSAFSEK